MSKTRLIAGEFLRRIREIKRESQAQVASRLAKPILHKQNYISELERGRTESIKDIKALARAYQLTKEEEKQFKKILILRRKGLHLRKESGEAMAVYHKLMNLPLKDRRRIIRMALKYDEYLDG